MGIKKFSEYAKARRMNEMGDPNQPKPPSGPMGTPPTATPEMKTPLAAATGADAQADPTQDEELKGIPNQIKTLMQRLHDKLEASPMGKGKGKQMLAELISDISNHFGLTAQQTMAVTRTAVQ